MISLAYLFEGALKGTLWAGAEVASLFMPIPVQAAVLGSSTVANRKELFNNTNKSTQVPQQNQVQPVRSNK